MFDRSGKLEKTLRRFPRAPLFARLADHYLRKGSLLRAQVLCEEGCERFPLYPTGFFVLSRCYEVQMMWEEARSSLDRGLRLDPDNPAGYRQLSRVYRHLGNGMLALKCLEKAAALDPLSEPLARELSLLASETRDEKPVELAPPVSVDDVTEEVADELDEESADEGLFDSDEESVDVDLELTAPESPERTAETVVEAISPTDIEPEAPEAIPEELPPSQTPAGAQVDPDPIVDESAAQPDASAPTDEPFGEVRPLPEWDEIEPATAPIETPAVIQKVEGPLVEEPSEPEEDVSESDEVAALGAGLFDDDLILEEEDRVAKSPAATGAELPPPPPETVEVPHPVPPPPAVAPEAAQPPDQDPPVLPSPKPATSGEPADTVEPETTVTRLRAPDDTEMMALLQQIDSAPVEEADAEATELQGPVPTVTLAQLYDRQGFPERALEIYQDVLSADPGNEAARRGAAALTAT